MRRGGDAWNERDLRIVSDSATPINQSETAAPGSGHGGTEGGSEEARERASETLRRPRLCLMASAASDQTPRPQSFDTTSVNVVDVCRDATFLARHHKHNFLRFVTFES